MTEEFQKMMVHGDRKGRDATMMKSQVNISQDDVVRFRTLQWRSQDNIYGRAHIGKLYDVGDAPGIPFPPSEGVWGSTVGANAFLIHIKLQKQHCI